MLPNPPNGTAEMDAAGEVERLRDCQRDASLWDLDTGEFLTPPAKSATKARVEADSWVKASLSMLATTGSQRERNLKKPDKT